MQELRVAPEYVDELISYATSEGLLIRPEKKPGDTHITLRGSIDALNECRAFIKGFSVGYIKGWAK